MTAYRSAFAAEEQRQQLEEMGVSKEVLDSYIQNHPAMQAGTAGDPPAGAAGGKRLYGEGI